MSDFAFRREPSKGGKIAPYGATTGGGDKEAVKAVNSGKKPLAWVNDASNAAPDVVVKLHDVGKLVYKEPDSHHAKALERAYKMRKENKITNESFHKRAGIALGYHNDDIDHFIKNNTTPKGYVGK